MSTLPVLKEKFRAVWPLLDERTRRVMAANEALSLGFGGISVVHCYLAPLWCHLNRGLMEPLKSRPNGATRIAA
jgi:hypothetical protein